MTGVPNIHPQSTLTALGSVCGHFGPDEDHIAIVARPMVHCSGLYTLFECVHVCAPMSLLERFAPDGVLNAIERHGWTWQLGLPFTRQRMRNRSVKSRRFCLTGGELLLTATATGLRCRV